MSHQGGTPKLCFEVCGLAEDEIEVLAEALKHRFNQFEPNAFTFTIRRSEDYSPLEMVKRRRGGDWADIPFAAGATLRHAVENVLRTPVKNGQAPETA